ncbi:PaaI family thioesterase [Salmonella enterica]|nr:PaaI family thioesterase [Salmonella enterica]
MNCYLNARKNHICCMVCGTRDNNPDTVNLMFSEYPDGSVCAVYTADLRHQGYTGLLHGGMTSTLLDAAMTHCLFMKGVQALTAELTVRFISPVCTGEKLMVCARLLGQRRGIYLVEAWLAKGQQKVARATAKFIVPSQDIALAHR